MQWTALKKDPVKGTLEGASMRMVCKGRRETRSYVRGHDLLDVLPESTHKSPADPEAKPSRIHKLKASRQGLEDNVK